VTFMSFKALYGTVTVWILICLIVYYFVYGKNAKKVSN